MSFIGSIRVSKPNTPCLSLFKVSVLQFLSFIIALSLTILIVHLQTVYVLSCRACLFIASRSTLLSPTRKYHIALEETRLLTRHFSSSLLIDRSTHRLYLHLKVRAYMPHKSLGHGLTGLQQCLRPKQRQHRHFTKYKRAPRTSDPVQGLLFHLTGPSSPCPLLLATPFFKTLLDK